MKASKKKESIFGVRSFFEWQVSKRDISLIEERVILFKAKNSDSAIKKAFKEARVYTDESFINVFGQKVKIKSLKHFVSYALYDDLKINNIDGIEVFSDCVISFGKKISTHYCSKIHSLKKNKNDEDKAMYYFRNIDFNKKLDEEQFFSKNKNRPYQKH